MVRLSYSSTGLCCTKGLLDYLHRDYCLDLDHWVPFAYIYFDEMLPY